eukprot:TRINITY_DN1968_c0_g1_i11.p2 TRINITY_DN1968_c0_g1~~TRINITY_DN1968_c0_g1_i11.p2  ORF type:complete len:196 (-),score=44.09 TRINITY_DN1968_c0_g1_i11:463-1050(-)
MLFLEEDKKRNGALTVTTTTTTSSVTGSTTSSMVTATGTTITNGTRGAVDSLLPTYGHCPSCEEKLKWSEVVAYRKKKCGGGSNSSSDKSVDGVPARGIASVDGNVPVNDENMVCVGNGITRGVTADLSHATINCTEPGVVDGTMARKEKEFKILKLLVSRFRCCPTRLLLHSYFNSNNMYMSPSRERKWLHQLQ